MPLAKTYIKKCTLTGIGLAVLRVRILLSGRRTALRYYLRCGLDVLGQTTNVIIINRRYGFKTGIVRVGTDYMDKSFKRDFRHYRGRGIATTRTVKKHNQNDC